MSQPGDVFLSNFKKKCYIHVHIKHLQMNFKTIQRLPQTKTFNLALQHSIAVSVYLVLLKQLIISHRGLRIKDFVKSFIVVDSQTNKNSAIVCLRRRTES